MLLTLSSDSLQEDILFNKTANKKYNATFFIDENKKKACNRSYACHHLRLPPSDLHAQQAQNSPRLMSVNLLPACSRALKIGGIQDNENKSIKAQYPKSIERKRLIKDFEVNLSLSLC